METPEAAPGRVHGSLVEVAGTGVLLLGRSGVGKSECALELVMRGHRLVADDVVLISAGANDVPEGCSPEVVRHFLELRGIGIVHVPSLFGERAVLDHAPIHLAIRLEAWGSGDIERIGLERHTERIAGFDIASLSLPVAPGRNVASLVEVGARNHVLRTKGRSGVEDLDERVFAMLRKGGP